MWLTTTTTVVVLWNFFLTTYSTFVSNKWYVFLCSEKGRVIGGTKGNKVLEYISGAPVKETTIDRTPNIFDYDELTKYGYSVGKIHCLPGLTVNIYICIYYICIYICVCVCFQRESSL